MLLFCVFETLLLFGGLALCYLVTSRGDPAVANSLNQVLSTILSTPLPPVPALDVFMWLRLLSLLALAIAMTTDLDFTFRTLMDWWDNVLLFIWDFVSDLGHVVVYFIDLLLPLYNWYITFVYQLFRGTYMVLAKCQVRSLVEAMIHVGEAMVSLGLSLTRFIMAPKGALDVYDTASSLQKALIVQESVFECACDGISPVFSIILDVFRSEHFGSIVNETLNTGVGFLQTVVLAVPPFSEIPDGARVFGPLKRVALATGFFLDEGLDRVLNRMFSGITFLAENIDGDTDDNLMELKLARLPVFSIFGYLGEAILGVIDMEVHTGVRILLGQPILYEPKSIYDSVENAIDSFEDVLILPMNVVGDLFGVDASPVPETVGYLAKALAGLVMSLVEMLYFMLRGDFVGLSFFEILQRMDGKWGEVSDYVSLQTNFFQMVDSATFEAEQFMLSWRWIPITVRVASRLLNMLLRLILSSGDVVHGEFFHVPINCGYGENKFCTEECSFYYDPDNPYLPFSRTSLNVVRAEDSTGVNPCNSLIIEWVFDAVDDFANALSGWFQMVRPQHSTEWCEKHVFGISEGRCTSGNKDFMCATSNSLLQVIEVPLNVLRHAIQKLTYIWSRPGDVMTMEVEDRLCDVSTALYALASTFVALLPTDLINDTFEERLTNVVHSLVVIPVDAVRLMVITLQFLVGILGNYELDWDRIRGILDAQLISDDFVYTEKSVEMTDTSLTLAANTGNFMGTAVVLLLNSVINVFHSFGELFGGDNMFNAVADIMGILKEAVSAEMINLVVLIFKVFGHLLAMMTTGETDLGELGEDFALLITKALKIVASVASSILASLLQLLGPVGDFLLFIWRGLCEIGDFLEDFLGLEFGSVCDAVDNVRRRLTGGMVNGTGWYGDTECDLLARHYDGHPFDDLVYLEQIRLLECAEQRGLVRRLSATLDVKLPDDMLHNWKRKYLMAYEAVLGFILYNKYDHKHMLVEWDRLELPRYWLTLWSRVQIKIPWINVLDDALTTMVKPVPELTSMYATAKSTLVKFHGTWRKYGGLEMPVMGTYGSEYVRERVHRAVSRRQLAWGLKSNVDIVGPTNCAIVDNFFWAMGNASYRVSEYYNTTFVEHVSPQFVDYLRGKPRVYPPLNNSMPELKLPSVSAIKSALLFNFESCEAYDITCRVDERFDRVNRITESLWYVLYALFACTILMLLSGISFFTLLPLAPLIVYAHTWNYRFTCLPNIPECAYDDLLLWLNIFRPQNWTGYFPILSNESLVGEVECPVDNSLWSSVYFLGKTFLVYPIEFAVYWTPYYDDFVDWVSPSAEKDECLWVRGVEMVYIPLISYGLFTCWGFVAWGLRVLSLVMTILSDLAASTYGIESALRSK